MAILGSGFNRINIMRNEQSKGQVEAVHNVFISNVEKAPLKVGKNQESALKITFEFSVRYEPNAGSITLGGYILYLTGDKETAEILEKWNKEKKVSKELTKEVFTHAVPKCNLECAVLSREVNLPPPFPLPRIKVESGK